MCELAVELEMTDPVDTKFDYETIDGTHLSGRVFSFNPADELEQHWECDRTWNDESHEWDAVIELS